MTERIYYLDSHLHMFTTAVRSCEEEQGRYAVILEATAFFPEGGGQAGDTGTLNGVRVLDTREKNGEIVHYCSGPIGAGESVQGVLDWDQRFRRMQSHSGEHILSGIAHSLWGCENVGFHMAEKLVTVDLDRELSAEQLTELERRVNGVIWDNVPIRAVFPSAEELAVMEYRQKKPLEGAIRIVEIEGVDRCACCAPHVDRTGEIGSVLITDAMRHRGGTRLTMLAGRNAWEHVREREDTAASLSRLFSVPRENLVPAAEKLLEDLEKANYAKTGLERELLQRRAEELPETEGSLVLFEEEERSADAMRTLASAGAEKAGLVCAVFSGAEGSRRYVIASKNTDLKKAARRINSGIGGRGGGSSEMLQGSASASRAQIEEFFGGWHGEIE